MKNINTVKRQAVIKFQDKDLKKLKEKMENFIINESYILIDSEIIADKYTLLNNRGDEVIDTYTTYTGTIIYEVKNEKH